MDSGDPLPPKDMTLHGLISQVMQDTVGDKERIVKRTEFFNILRGLVHNITLSKEQRDSLFHIFCHINQKTNLIETLTIATYINSLPCR